MNTIIFWCLVCIISMSMSQSGQDLYLIGPTIACSLLLDDHNERTSRCVGVCLISIVNFTHFRLIPICCRSRALWYPQAIQHQGKYCEHIIKIMRKLPWLTLPTRSCGSELWWVCYMRLYIGFVRSASAIIYDLSSRKELPYTFSVACLEFTLFK